MNLKTITFDLLCAAINQTERKTKYFRHARHSSQTSGSLSISEQLHTYHLPNHLRSSCWVRGGAGV